MSAAGRAYSRRHWIPVEALGHWLRDALTWAREAMCGLRGHDFLLHFGSRRMWLECSICSHRTSGWHFSPSPQTRRSVSVRTTRVQNEIRVEPSDGGRQCAFKM